MTPYVFQEKLAQWLPRVLLIAGFGITVVGGVLLFTSRSAGSGVQENTEDGIKTIQCQDETQNATQSGILVYVSGAVKKPGVYTLSPDSNRVFQAIEHAGGFSPLVDTTYVAKTLNMVGKLKDGERIYVPLAGENETKTQSQHTQDLNSTQTESADTSQTTTTRALVNPNTASQRALEDLNGIGARRAEQLMQGRPYADINDFRSRSGVPNAVIDTIERQLIFSTD